MCTYRNLYKKHYGIDFDDSLEVHHINGNRKDNEINNLILLPKELHQQYHKIIKLSTSITINWNLTTFEIQLLEEVSKIMDQIDPWKTYKKLLDLEQRKAVWQHEVFYGNRRKI